MEKKLNREFVRFEEGVPMALTIDGPFFVRPKTPADRFDPKPACRATIHPNWPKKDGSFEAMVGVNNLCKGVIEQAESKPEWYVSHTFRLTMGAERPGRSRLWDVIQLA